jgi:Ca-activated chloride channel family protein
MPLANVVLVLDDSLHTVITDSLGRFDLGVVAPDQQVKIRTLLLGFADLDSTLTPQSGELVQLALQLQPVIVATLDAFAIKGDAYMVEMGSVTTEQKIGSQRLSKYAIDSVEDAVAKEAGVMMRDGQLYVRGGRSGETSMRIDPVPVIEGVPKDRKRSGDMEVADTLMDMDEVMDFGSNYSAFRAPPPGSVTGGTTPPNGETYELMYFDHTGVNPFVATEDDSLSTFAVDVDDASFTLARSYLERGQLPPEDAIRVEEFINVFDGGWTEHRNKTFRIHIDGAPSRYGQGYHMLRIGLRGKEVAAADRKPAVLIFTIDVSGSMNREDRLGLVKHALRDLVANLKDDDQVGLVIYGSRGQVVLEPTGLEGRKELLDAIDKLRSGGSTNAHEGLKLAYNMAREYHQPGKIHRVILCSDGVANTGRTRAEDILEDVRKAADRGVHLTTVGFGMGNYNDVMMEKLADSGDGHYHYVDDRDEAERVFRQNLTGMLQTIARDVKIQVEFDPDRVLRWRLLGYENRDVADRDFRNDDVDAGEVGAGHTVTALYEVKLDDETLLAMSRSKSWGANSELATVRVRHEAPAHDTAQAGIVSEIEQVITPANLKRDESQGATMLRVQALAAEFAEILRGSYWAKESSPSDLVARADALASETDDERVGELAEMIRRAANLWDERTDR